MSKALSNFINGEWLAGSGAELVTIDPSNGKQTWASNESTAQDVASACAAARGAFEAWALTPLADRIAVCTRFRDLLKQDAEELALLIAEEVGKPMWEARTEVTTMANKIDISVQAYGARTGETQNKVADGEAVLRHRPHGVFGVFGPYNFPGHLPNGHIVPALIAGNTVVFKPSEYAPRTAVKTVQLWEKAGVPKGVINLVNGGRDAGVALGQNELLDGVLFTGSCQTGTALHKQFGGQPGKMLALEMGGNNPLVVWDVKDIDAAVFMAISSAFISAGQRCTCARRLIVKQGAEGDAIVARLVDVASRLTIGASAAEPAPFMGPVVSAAIAKRLVQAQADMIAKGGKSLLSMRQLVDNTGFVSAGIVDVTDAKGIPDEEWFGPLLQVIRVADFDSAIKAANATEFGLASALISNDENLWKIFQVRARAGIVNWNRPTTGAASSAPFGGVGKSGNHRPSAYYAADYCAYPVASIENNVLEMPAKLSPGMHF
ncbi:succinylglutamate-semialdehyde dehydrogenase [Duganella sp. BJB488]|uniref:succinylglutamate-semialdehyde dehydrogenase n=1 Tax=unclassified Duganella TaxID=2636909 RepID=UPI000E3445AD|nr:MULTISPECIES: succinylglutamate-semialdehyde dehydrogenase [unclassified Duganella]RFP16948.1 succinylglutamate-semialdehyde dehydrogenase [Duganella sp. BJB489]RFP20632.1 succinylglutamate-semialdehyde dehydrogenase [Duganella sp. BJB488]RFP32314.1 succinylglutamate-semialdehyde dehydrogenase [Duganella sp. BJB480]